MDLNEVDALRRQIGEEQGLPEGWLHRLTGDSREEIEADCRVVLSWLAPPKPPPIRADAGARGDGLLVATPPVREPQGMDAQIRRALEARRAKGGDGWLIR